MAHALERQAQAVGLKIRTGRTPGRSASELSGALEKLHATVANRQQPPGLPRADLFVMIRFGAVLLVFFHDFRFRIARHFFVMREVLTVNSPSASE